MILSQKLNIKFHALSFLTAALCSAGAQFVIADSTKIEEIFVTATRTEQALDDVIGSAVVITRESIQTIHPYDLNDLLELEAGVDVLRSGSRGSLSSLQIRGASAAQSLILVNGQRVAGATSGIANYTLLPPELLTRVEVLKGASSALYGSDAIGGVVNAITYTGPNLPAGVRINIDYGSHQYYRDAIAANTQAGNFYFTAAFNRENSKGMDNTVAKDGTLADDDGYKRLGGAIAINYAPDEKSQINFLHMANASESDYDSSALAQPYSDTALELTQLTAKKTVDQIYSTEINISQANDESEEKDHLVKPWPSLYNTQNTNGSWLNNFNVAGQTLVVGYEFHRAHIESTDKFVTSAGQSIHKAESESGFVAINGDISVVSYALGGRFDDRKAVGNKATQSAAVSVNFVGNQHVYTRYAEGFRAPTLNDLYSPWGGNDQLKPESSEQYELGYKYVADKLHAQLAFYKNNVTDLIDWRPVSEYDWRPLNIGEATLKGVELTLAYSFDVLGDFKITSDYLDARNSLTNIPLNYRPKRNLGFMWVKNLNQFEFGLQSKWQGQRQEPSAVVAGYGLLNASAAYKVNGNFTVNVKVNNIGDKNYHLKSAYLEDGRNFVVGVRASF